MNFIIPITLIFLGEAMAIVAELFAAKGVGDGLKFSQVFLIWFGVITLSGAALVLGYMLGYSQSKNIWIITTLSLGAILVVEPVLNIFLFGQTPTTGAGIGLVFGILGIIATVLW